MVTVNSGAKGSILPPTIPTVLDPLVAFVLTRYSQVLLLRVFVGFLENAHDAIILRVLF